MTAETRHIGLVRATAVGIGAIVGGGILVLAGVALATAGPSSIIAFALNGVIAVLTALTFAEMATSFPESGGAYTFAKKVLSVRAAFGVGWIVWFAYIVAGVLYALGFASYALLAVEQLTMDDAGSVPAWVQSRTASLALALIATTGYTVSLIRKESGGGEIETWGKVVLFAILVFAGFWVLAGRPAGTVARGMSPFFAGGATGLLEAMGATFIALQGFDLIAAIAGEVKTPDRVIPRAMLLSLGAGIVIYLPLLFIVSTVGVGPGENIVAMSAAQPETVMAVAVRNYLGPVGYWLVVLAAVLSTLSALHANILAASRVALSMAEHRTLPAVLRTRHPTRRTPLMALYTTALAVVAIVLMVPDVAAAGAAASLIFLISFALVHWTAILARSRGQAREGAFRTPYFPAVPVIGGVACAGMAVYQAVAVPAAGAVTLVWLGLGVLLYFGLFADRAEAMDASAEALDPHLVRLRGRSPLVLVPVANPAHAPAMVAIAGALSPPGVGRVLLLTVMAPPDGSQSGVPESLITAQAVLREAVSACVAGGHNPEALMTIAPVPWTEITRVARGHGCEGLMLGFSLTPEGPAGHLEEIINDVGCDTAFLRSPPGWDLSQARRILVPVGGRGGQHELRSRMLASLGREGKRTVTFLSVVPEDASRAVHTAVERRLKRLAEDEVRGHVEVALERSNDPVAAIARYAAESDLMILGLQQLGSGRKVFGKATLAVVEATECATIMISGGH